MIGPAALLPPFIRRRVGLQLVVVCALVLAVGAVASASYAARRQKEVLLGEVRRQGHMLAGALATCCVEPMTVQDVPVLRAYVHSLVDSDRVTWAEIERADGVVLASSGTRRGQGLVYSAPVVMPPDEDGSGAPRPLGTVQVELSTAHARTVAGASSRLLYQQWGVTFLGLAVALSLVFRFVVHGRLDRLARQAVRLGRGDLTTPVGLHAPDELGQLASILDDVRRRLGASYHDLQQRNAQLQELDRLKSEFLANVSHEIRTPLNGVLGFAEVLAQRDFDPDTADAIATIFGSARALRALVDDLLEFSRIESGDVRIHARPVDLRALLADVASLHAAQVRHQGLELRIEVDAGVPARLRLDPLHLRQVLSKLTGNAVKFTERGRIVLRAAVIDGAMDGTRLLLEVEDTGVGFDPARAEGLFQSFRQLDGTGSRRHGGTGLGLVVARRLVERMGGTIHAEGAVGSGSRFWLELPVVLDPGSARDRAPPEAARPRRAARVLVVDDNAVNCRLAAAMLRKLGHEPTTVPSGQAALEALHDSHPFDLVLMDLQMPVMDGFETTRRIRALKSSTASIPILAFTANHLPGDPERCAEAGMNDYLTKPIELAVLTASLDPWTACA